MKTTLREQRPKAFIGTAISVGTSLIGGIIGGAKRRKAERRARLEAERKAKFDAAVQSAQIETQQAQQTEETYDDIRRQLMKRGGFPRKGVLPVITEGGSAIPIGNDSFVLKGRKHSDGGIVIGKGKNSIEAEAGEVVKLDKRKNKLKILSTLPLTKKGVSPADIAMSNPSKTDAAFKEQESYKKAKGITNNNAKAKLGLSKKFKEYWKDAGEDVISSAAGAVGSLVSGLMNKKSIGNIEAPRPPQLVAPAAMKTTVNVNPQLSDIRQNELTTNRNIEGNTASSVANIARQARVSGMSLSNRNQVRANKENIEIELKNRDALNRQQVAAANAQTTNAYNNMVTQINNEKTQALANNRTSMIDSVTGAVRDFQLGRDTKNSQRLALAAMMAKNPEQVDLFFNQMDKNTSRLKKMKGMFACGGSRKLKK